MVFGGTGGLHGVFGEGWGWWQHPRLMAANFMCCKTDAVSLKVMLRMLRAPWQAWVQLAPGRRGEVQL